MYFKSWNNASQLCVWSQAFVAQDMTFITYLKVLIICTSTTSLCSKPDQILTLTSSRGLPLCVEVGLLFAWTCAGSLQLFRARGGSMWHSEHGHQPQRLCSSAPAPPCRWGAASHHDLCIAFPLCKGEIKDSTHLISFLLRRC